MNEIITKLNEIEEKADAILSDARGRKEEMMVQLERDKREIDAEYNRLEAESMKKLEASLRRDAATQIAAVQAQNQKSEESFEQFFSEKKEELVEEILQRIIE